MGGGFSTGDKREFEIVQKIQTRGIAIDVEPTEAKMQIIPKKRENSYLPVLI